MPDTTINFAARCEYLSALELHWPDVMTSLRQDAFPAYRACLETSAEHTPLQTLVGLSEARRHGGSPELNHVEQALQKWADAHRFQDAWLRDVALQSMYSWARGEAISKWTYFPEELQTPRFQVDFGHWIPSETKWPEFKRLSDKNYRGEQARYRARVRKLWGENQPKLSQSAVWTVLWQRGKSPEAIRTHHLKTTGKNVSRANIQLRVHAFAASAGLSLRAAKAGRGPRM